ncbi:MAG TPA: hypothetical protein PLI68_06750 [Bacteroidia bacterium]|nr:hypothetical protein [Bacteroidia bacterium]
MIKAYLTFCSVVYHFYVRKKDNMPVMFTFYASSLMLFANLFGLFDIIMFYIFPEVPFSTTLVFIFFGLICLLNYFLVFQAAHYKEIVPSKNSGLYSVLYIVFSVLLIAWISTKQHDKNLQEKQRQQIEQRQ